jgi:hypothetical protein
MIGDAKTMARIRITIAICLALAFTLALASDAGAKKATAKRATVASSVSVDVVGPDGASGHVQSARHECAVQREISFYRVNTQQSVPSNEPVGVTWTGSDGSWTIQPPLYPSAFVAVAEAKKTKRTVCPPATSNSLGWG